MAPSTWSVDLESGYSYETAFSTSALEDADEFGPFQAVIVEANIVLWSVDEQVLLIGETDGENDEEAIEIEVVQLGNRPNSVGSWNLATVRGAVAQLAASWRLPAIDELLREVDRAWHAKEKKA